MDMQQQSFRQYLQNKPDINENLKDTTRNAEYFTSSFSKCWALQEEYFEQIK